MKKFIAILLVAVTLFSIFAVTASAATWGGRGSSTVTVKSKANYWYPGASSITLRQSKQTMTFDHLWKDKTKTKTGYFGHYDITVYNVTKGTSKYVYWNGGQTKKITLDPNCTYRITVTYLSTETTLFTKAPTGYSHRSTTSPSWNVKSVWKVSSYY